MNYAELLAHSNKRKRPDDWARFDPTTVAAHQLAMPPLVVVAPVVVLLIFTAANQKIQG